MTALDFSRSQNAGNSVAEILARCRELVEPALREAVAHLHPWPGLMATFTFGWSEADGTPRDDQSGKGLRPAIALLCAQAVGAPAAAGVPGAAAVELVHAFSLVHDDIMDGDERRRHRETAWKAYGVGPAVLAGDALLALAMSTLARTASTNATATLAPLSNALIELVHGQAEDVAFENRPWIGPRAVTVAEYQDMAARKTGALLGCAASIGALLGGAAPALADAMARMGRHLGIAFQAIDDLLGIWGDPEITGKPVFNDLRQGKKTLPIVAALERDTEPGRRLAELLANRPADVRTLRRAADLINAAGGRSFTRAQAERHLDNALGIIDSAGLDDRAAGELTELSRFLVERTH
jgi:geranylgeranyl diphosphate synthase type I